MWATSNTRGGIRLRLEGEIELDVDGTRYLVGPGDSFSFRSERKHSYRNSGRGIARALWINTPPTF
jgi:uncharacterized cupin superfamily protein